MESSEQAFPSLLFKRIPKVKGEILLYYAFAVAAGPRFPEQSYCEVSADSDNIGRIFQYSKR